MTKIELDSAKVEALAALQCTFDEIASGLGISTDTLDRRRKEEPDIAEAIKKGRELGTRSLRRLQWDAAKSGNVTMQIWLGKQWLKQTDKHEVAAVVDLSVRGDPVDIDPADIATIERLRRLQLGDDN